MTIRRKKPPTPPPIPALAPVERPPCFSRTRYRWVNTLSGMILVEGAIEGRLEGIESENGGGGIV